VTTPRIHSTPPEAVKERILESVIVGEETFRIERPWGSDQLFDHPAVCSAYASDEYIPYWADLWPASRMLAKAILGELPVAKPTHALEIACGLGLAGIAALRRGYFVTFSDIDELAVTYAADNARRNGFREGIHFETAAIDLRSPPADLAFDVLLGADLLYEERMVEPVVDFLCRTPMDFAWIADPDRQAAKPFKHLCREAGLELTATFARAGEPGGERTKGTIYRVRKPTVRGTTVS